MIADLKNWVYIIQGLIALGIIIYTWTQSRSKANQSAINEINKDITQLNHRVTKMESVVDKGDLVAIHERINDIDANVSHTNGQLEQINKTLSLIQSALIKPE